MPLVDKRMNGIRDHFFKQMEECPRDTTLSSAHTATIADSFSSLCWASVGGFSKMVAQQETNEAEARHDWDFLMYLMYLSQSDINPSRPLLERTIFLSRNVAVASFDDPNFVQTFKACVRESLACSRHTAASANEWFTDLSDVFLQANEAYNICIKQTKAVVNLFEVHNVKDVIQTRADMEPKTATCDLILPLPLDVPHILPAPLIRMGKPKPGDDADQATGSKSGSRRSSVSGRPTSFVTSRSLHYIPEARDSSEEQEKVMTNLITSVVQQGPVMPEEVDAEKFRSSDLQDPFSVNRSETRKAEPLPSDTVKEVRSLVGLLLLAVLVGEYKKHSDRGFMKPLVQTRMYTEASCRHLASLGVTDHPVFGLATNGCEGAVFMGWYSRAKDVVYLMERNIRTFNISSPYPSVSFCDFYSSSSRLQPECAEGEGVKSTW